VHGLQAREVTERVSAVVVTHMRPRLCGDLVRSLVAVEHIPPEKVVVVVNGEGGLDDSLLEAAVTMLRLPRNQGPAGGFKAGIEEAFADPSTDWAYLCEDDVGLLALPVPRVGGLLERIDALRPAEQPIGAVVAYGRVFSGRAGHTLNLVPRPGSPQNLDPVDVSAWGATLLSRAVYSAGVLPEPDWFFGFEDFDYFCRIRKAGFSVLVDSIAARSVAEQQTSKGRDEAFSDRRPGDSDEGWRAYYVARNFFTLARRHGSPTWMAYHLAYSARRLQLARSGAERIATLRGLRDGALGRLGEHPRYHRDLGEFSVADKH
jgi:rhamnopyranosyl-N-acetylglucosaminyl-diphospho-decaprenol beta-1,3/1,4-galactofuranosyltransferase